MRIVDSTQQFVQEAAGRDRRDAAAPQDEVEVSRGKRVQAALAFEDHVALLAAARRRSRRPTRPSRTPPRRPHPSGCGTTAPPDELLPRITKNSPVWQDRPAADQHG